MMGIFKDKLDYDGTDITNSDTVGATLLNDAGAEYTSTTVDGDTTLDVHLSGIGGDAFLAEDEAMGGGLHGIIPLMQREDTLATSGSADGDAVYFKATSTGELYTHDADAITELQDIEADLESVIETFDAAQAGTMGFMVAGIRQDAAGSPVSADGDVHPFVFNNDGELKVAADLTSSVADDDADSGNPIKVGSRGVDGLLTALSASDDRADLLSDLYRRIWVNQAPNVGNSVTTSTVGTTAVELAATPLAGRTNIMIQNNANKPIYIGTDGTVTAGTGVATDGIKLNKGATLTMEYGEDLNVFAIGESGTSGTFNVTTFEAG